MRVWKEKKWDMSQGEARRSIKAEAKHFLYRVCMMIRVHGSASSFAGSCGLARSGRGHDIPGVFLFVFRASTFEKATISFFYRVR